MRLLVAIMVALVLFTASAGATRRPAQPAMIRDAEIESTIRAYATPLFQAAGIAPDVIHLHLVVDSSLNAFVAEGLNMYFHTGLLIRTETANQLIGVIAHETGHISGGHLVRRGEDVDTFQAEALLATVLGAATAVATGRGDVGAAVAMAGTDFAMKSFFSYTRGQESSADAAGMKFLDTTRQSSRGLLEFFHILGDQEILLPAQQDPYARTHPLTRDRVELVRHHVEITPYSDESVRPEFAERHRRLRAKLRAFLEPTGKTLLYYKETDKGLDARYARAVAFYRRADLAQALPLVDGLIAERPRDPYFLELKGQMLFENGRGRESLDPYRQAVTLAPESALLRIALAQALIEQDDPLFLSEATDHLKAAIRREPDNPFAWNQLAISYGRAGNDGMAEYAMAEYAMLAVKPTEAAYHAGKALTLVPKGTPVSLRVLDIHNAAINAKKKK